MKLLFTGRGSSGSWKIRGEQLGNAIGARIEPNAAYSSVAWSDITVVVKRCPSQLLEGLRKTKKKWVLDVLDFYPQPQCGGWTQSEAISWVRQKIVELNPFAVIWPNARMQQDCSDGRPSTVLYHHHHPTLQQHIPRSTQSLHIAYEGCAKYLGDWEPFLQSECRNRGWQFTVNPPFIHQCDAVVAVRARTFAGYAQVHWKSNVKLANAQGSGIPFIGQPECGYTETSCGWEMFADSKWEMEIRLNEIDNLVVRQKMSQKQLEKRYTVQQAAADLRGFLSGL